MMTQHEFKFMHTPGPWWVLGTGDLKRGIADLTVLGKASTGERIIICEIGPDLLEVYPGQAECNRQAANARLIAASPRLLKELQDCLELLEFIHADLGKHNCTTGCPDIGKRTTRAHAIIAEVAGKDTG